MPIFAKKQKTTDGSIIFRFGKFFHPPKAFLKRKNEKKADFRKNFLFEDGFGEFWG
ncbi:MAG: hypothetical protein J6A23_03355 [Thermoguttaceae bacterium]|nr:hypothetical protein [Thermoguttaceae bacterium]MBP3694240.1 hypothetical protein [Thermoguttaceae bacterium]